MPKFELMVKGHQNVEVYAPSEKDAIIHVTRTVKEVDSDHFVSAEDVKCLGKLKD